MGFHERRHSPQLYIGADNTTLCIKVYAKQRLSTGKYLFPLALNIGRFRGDCGQGPLIRVHLFLGSQGISTSLGLV